MKKIIAGVGTLYGNGCAGSDRFMEEEPAVIFDGRHGPMCRRRRGDATVDACTDSRRLLGVPASRHP